MGCNEFCMPCTTNNRQFDSRATDVHKMSVYMEKEHYHLVRDYADLTEYYSYSAALREILSIVASVYHEEIRAKLRERNQRRKGTL